jgi:hypothetical protein
VITNAKERSGDSNVAPVIPMRINITSSEAKEGEGDLRLQAVLDQPSADPSVGKESSHIVDREHLHFIPFKEVQSLREQYAQANICCHHHLAHEADRLLSPTIFVLLFVLLLLLLLLLLLFVLLLIGGLRAVTYPPVLRSR